jgi:lipoate-protein ligase A
MAVDLRIIVDPPAPARFNMAADMHLLERAAHREQVCVRFYQWAPTAVTIGWMQRPGEALDLPALQSSGVEWVRRPTGGRAVLHDSDLTYSVVFPRGLPGMGKTVAQTYRIIAGALIVGLQQAGIACDTHDSTLDTALVRREGKLPCFLAPNREEIMCTGRKLVGSAQKRVASAVLQHGSIPMDGSFRRIPELSVLSAKQRATYREMLERKCTCVGEIAPGLSVERLTSSLADGFASRLGLKSTRRDWSKAELKQIDSLAGSPEFIATYASERSRP